MIVWINGSFGAGKSTLAQELRGRLPGAVLFDPEDVGFMLWRWLEPGDDFQDLPSWRELVVASALSLRRHHADTLIVPMSLIVDRYRDEILDGLAAAGEEVVHIFLNAGREELTDRLRRRADGPSDPDARRAALDWALRRIDAALDAAEDQPAGTVVLRSDALSPEELADAVMQTLRALEPADGR